MLYNYIYILFTSKSAGVRIPYLGRSSCFSLLSSPMSGHVTGTKMWDLDSFGSDSFPSPCDFD